MSSALQALLGGAGPPSATGGPAPGGPTPGAAPGPGGQGIPGQPDNDAAQQALDMVLQGLQDFLDNEQDDQDKSIAAKCLAQLQSIKGTRQKNTEAAAGITPAHKAMGRAMSSGGGAGPDY